MPPRSMPAARFTLSALLLCCYAASAGSALDDSHKDSGEEINATCAACHGVLGQGGKQGEYPRLAGQRAAYLEYSLRQFRNRERINIPMLPYANERELSDDDIKAVSAYLAAIVLPTRPPEFKPTDDALTRLRAMENVMIVPKLPGDLANGKRLYDAECASCHGSGGRGFGRFPMLVGQYTNYLKRQIDIYLRKERPHLGVSKEEAEDGLSAGDGLGALGRLTAKDIDDILAHITHLQDAQP
ncbi:MAG: cytochrome c [Sulfuritalea sp.]|nr:cytochrome c [Sulfuritalea sp.]